MKTHILRVECADEKGLVYKVTGILYKHGLNIVSNDEFVDHEKKRFFMRTEYSGETDSKKILKELSRQLPKDAIVQLAPDRKKNIVIFATKEYHCLADLLLRHAHNELHANILAVVSNHRVLAPLTAQFKIPYHCLPCEGKTREEHEAAILKVVGRLRPEFLVLAKYMRILSGQLVRHFENRIINIHHSFLPAFTGANPYQQAAQRGVKIIGATAHYVTEDLDEGPIIAQDVIPVDHSHSVVDMAQAGRDVEKNVLARALKLVFEDRVFVSDNKTILFD